MVSLRPRLVLALALSGCASAAHPPVVSTAPASALVEVSCVPPSTPPPALRGLRTWFVGNQRMSAEALSCVLANGLSAVPEPGTEDERRALAERASMLLQAHYYNFGFLLATVSTARAEGSLRFTIHEGEPHRVSSVSIRETDDHGAPAPSLLGDEPLRAMLHVQPGDPWRREGLMRDFLAIQRRYRDEGYALVAVVPLTDLGPAPGTAGLRVEVRRGPLVTVERVHLAGVQGPRAEALLAGFHPSAGERFHETALEASRQRLLARGARRAEVSTEAVAGRDDRVIINVEVQE